MNLSRLGLRIKSFQNISKKTRSSIFFPKKPIEIFSDLNENLVTDILESPSYAKPISWNQLIIFNKAKNDSEETGAKFQKNAFT